jgi:hypothetical protein
MGVFVCGQNGRFKNRGGQRVFSTSRFIPTLYFAGSKPGSGVGPHPIFSPKAGSDPGFQIAQFSRCRDRPSQWEALPWAGGQDIVLGQGGAEQCKGPARRGKTSACARSDWNVCLVSEKLTLSYLCRKKHIINHLCDFNKIAQSGYVGFLLQRE